MIRKLFGIKKQRNKVRKSQSYKKAEWETITVAGKEYRVQVLGTIDLNDKPEDIADADREIQDCDLDVEDENPL
tara:strand:- start:472 stop:693 length:222 start_codon:yes stop_codon:yes gene_type:complete